MPAEHVNLSSFEQGYPGNNSNRNSGIISLKKVGPYIPLFILIPVHAK